MFLEVIYGHLSGSLSLVSDGIHMLCDSLALLMGLLVSYISKSQKHTESYPFGLVKIEPLFGLLNGIFLMIVSMNLMSKGYTKMINPSDINNLYT